MAGSEKTGYSNASDILLENAFYAITPTKSTTKDMLARYIELVKLTGAIPVVLEPEHHDYSVAGISHVPHIIAASLVNLIKHSDDENGTMKLLAAGGFKDITRIASSSPEMWEQICTTNTDAIVKLLGDYIDYLTKIKDINGRPTAKVMLFNGISYSNNQGTIDYLYNPYLKENLALTYQMYLLGKTYYPDFFRCIYIEAYRYNLHLCKRSMLIEAGAQTNSFEEDKNAMEPLSELIARELCGEKIIK